MDRAQAHLPAAFSGVRVARRWGACIASAGALLLLGAPAFADEPASATEPRIMREPGEITNVIDAFDDGDVFDVNVSLGFSYHAKTAKILRETSINEPGLTTGLYTSNRLNVADYSETTSRLIPRIDVGLYKDLALYLRMPIVLNNTRELTEANGGTAPSALAGNPGEQLFGLPFQSPDRSGIEYLAVGLNWNAFFFNQARDESKPSWLLGFEGRFPIGESMHACNANPAGGQVECANPADINRNGRRDGDLEGNDVGENDPGLNRGTVGFQVHTYVSKRYKYIEPYWGLEGLFEFATESSEYGATDFSSSQVNNPPYRGKMLAGVMIIPWENKEKFGRLTFDARLDGEYISEGRDYSELFDALGSSAAASLRQPTYARYVGRELSQQEQAACADDDPSTFCPASSVADLNNPAYFTGLTTVAAHGAYRISGSVTWQASEFVKFNVGMGFRHEQSHFITGDKACNSDDKSSLAAAGPCRRSNGDGTFTSTGVPNPNHRRTIDLPGRRFLVDDSNTFDVFAAGVVMF